MRFSEPSLGLQNQTVPIAHQWQVQVSYQYANTHQLFVGDRRDDSAGPFGVPPHRKVVIYDLNVLYALTNHVTVDLTVPYLLSRGGTEQGTAQSHQFYEIHASGVGDMALNGDFWLSNPTKSRRISGSIGLGLKMPTGKNSAATLNHNVNPPAVRPIDESFQTGSGGWVILLRAQGAARIAEPLFAYAGGFYGMSLTEHTNVVQGGTFRAVPDTYSARAGLAWLLPFARGVTVSGGGRINGITRRDLIAGGNLYFRRPGYEVYVEPGVSWTSGSNTASVSVPLRVYQNKLDSLQDVSLHQHTGADFAPYLIIASYARRF